MERSANDQLGGATERRYRKKILKIQNYYMTVAMGVDIRLCSDRKGAASRACSERNITCENTFVANVAKSKQIDARFDDLRR